MLHPLCSIKGPAHAVSSAPELLEEGKRSPFPPPMYISHLHTHEPTPLRGNTRPNRWPSRLVTVLLGPTHSIGACTVQAMIVAWVMLAVGEHYHLSFRFELIREWRSHVNVARVCFFPGVPEILNPQQQKQLSTRHSMIALVSGGQRILHTCTKIVSKSKSPRLYMASLRRCYLHLS